MAGTRVTGTPAGDHLEQVPIAPVDPGLFRLVLRPEEFQRLVAVGEEARALFAGRVIWNVNSTARGGGVAELLQSLLAYTRGAGIDARWVVMKGDPDFFRVTKRIHNQIQGFAGDGGELGQPEHDRYEQTLAPVAKELSALMGPRDLVVLHDPQTAGLTPFLNRVAARVVWRCHVGMDSTNKWGLKAWSFLAPYLVDADAYVFSRRSFAWEGLDQAKISVIPPSIDPFTPKNNLLSHSRVSAILNQAGLLPDSTAGEPDFVTHDGSLRRVERRATVVETAPPPTDARLVVQVSRWDRLKDPVGVLTGFGEYVAEQPGVHLVLAGPEVTAVADDPEGAEVLEETTEAWRVLPSRVRERAHLALLPMEDLAENAAIVNALQRRAEIVVQKSLAEGFGLTVSEAMWKARPVVASAIGGIVDQVEDARTGILLPNPADLKAYGQAVSNLLADPDLGRHMGTAAQERVRDNFLNERQLRQYHELFNRLGV